MILILLYTFIHFLSTAGMSTFEDFACKVFLPYVNRQLKDSDRLDIVWDTYLSNSIKGFARKKRGKGVWRKVAGSNRSLENNKSFRFEVL